MISDQQVLTATVDLEYNETFFSYFIYEKQIIFL